MVASPPPLVVGDELWLYYSGYDEAHDLLPYQSAIGLAKMRKDGFVSLDADEVAGEIVTKRFSGRIRGDAGELQRTRRFGAGGTARRRRQSDSRVCRSECEPLEGDAVRKVVAWKDKKELRAAPVRCVSDSFSTKLACILSCRARR
jgi:hypothetical protein